MENLSCRPIKTETNKKKEKQNSIKKNNEKNAFFAIRYFDRKS